jgi:hypothetical protein
MHSTQTRTGITMTITTTQAAPGIAMSRTPRDLADRMAARAGIRRPMMVRSAAVATQERIACVTWSHFQNENQQRRNRSASCVVACRSKILLNTVRRKRPSSPVDVSDGSG